MVVRIALAIDDDDARRDVQDALHGPGGLIGVRNCESRPGELVVTLDDAVTSPELVRYVAQIEQRRRGGATPRTLEAAARAAAHGLQDPQLDAERIIERYLDAEEAPR